MSKSVSILGGYQSDFADNLAKSGGSVESLVRDTVLAATADAQIDLADIDTIHVGNAFGQLYTGQGHLGAMPATVIPELWGVPAMRHEAACASSSMAALSAMAEIEDVAADAARDIVARVAGAEVEPAARRLRSRR